MTFHWSGTLNLSSAWWLSGGILQSNCVAAYTPKGAGSLSDSYINSSNPGYYDATVGVAPTWDTTNGWKFNGSTQYLKTGITPANGYSGIIKFNNVTSAIGSKMLFGAYPAALTKEFFIIPRKSGDIVWYNAGGNLQVGAGLTSGVLGIAGTIAYRNGSPETGTVPGIDGTSTQTIYVGAGNDAGNPNYYLAVYIQAFAIYNTILTAAQVTALTNAMNAL